MNTKNLYCRLICIGLSLGLVVQTASISLAHAASVCGNWKVESPEQCDKGGSDTSTCDRDCTYRVCGDGYVNAKANEVCDDGANTGKPGFCRSGCTGKCGDGIRQSTYEKCDDGAENGQPGKCRTNCSGTCGDGTVQTPSEVCDDGEDENGQPGKCRADCSGRCGDGVVNGSETCDEGVGLNKNGAGPGHCLADCSAIQPAPGCGNNFVDAGEECDTGGESATCNSDCTRSECGDRKLNREDDEFCDEGLNKNGSGPGHCNDICSAIEPEAYCGDGIVNQPWERCDGGDGTTTDGESESCNWDCSLSRCGDGTLNPTAGEFCDGGTDNDRGLPGDCQNRCTERVPPPENYEKSNYNLNLILGISGVFLAVIGLIVTVIACRRSHPVVPAAGNDPGPNVAMTVGTGLAGKGVQQVKGAMGLSSAPTPPQGSNTKTVPTARSSEINRGESKAGGKAPGGRQPLAPVADRQEAARQRRELAEAEKAAKQSAKGARHGTLPPLVPGRD